MRKITALMDPSQNPNQLQDQEVFDTNMANWVDGMVLRGEQENALADDMEELFATMSATAAGGAYSFPYIFDSSTADSDPGVGKLRLGSTTQNASTVMRMDVQIVGGADISTALADLRAVTSAVKGSIRVVKMTDPSKWITFDVTTVALPSGYRNLTVSARATGGGSASPFANGDALMVFIERNGDKGEDAVGALQLLSSVTVGSAVAQIDFLNLFTSAYDRYTIVIQGVTPAAASRLAMRLATGGAVDAGSNYRTAINQFATSSAPVSLINLHMDTGTEFSFLIDLVNANAAGLKPMSVTGIYNQTVSPTGPVLMSGSAAHTAAAAATGFRLYMTTGANITAGTVRVYGSKNVI